MVNDRQNFIRVTFFDQQTEPAQDEDGNWIVPASTQTIIDQPALVEANSADQKVQTKDGQNIDFAFMVHLPKDCFKFDYGQKVEILNEQFEVIGEGEVKRFFVGKMGCRLWI